MMLPRNRLPETDIYAVLSSAHCRGRGNVETARLLLEAGVKIIQYREKDHPPAQNYSECRAIRDLCRQHGACFIVNDDAILARSVEADGLHLGQDDLVPKTARIIVGRQMLIGLSVSTVSQVDAAVNQTEVDYLGVGPIFEARTTKPDASQPGNLELLDYSLIRSKVPVVAIGGIGVENAAEVTARGRVTLAMISGLIGAEDIGQRVLEIRSAIGKARG
ncbi:thiamine phosphate synthase [Dehalogenimonas sp. 4OHTPN]|uniref:Thiamine-phosphate synthase n=1 Tax=Dehalogenimonas sp. 4OHTPN TaxID=3166643 RepID=A0AAU8G9H4_9CHLR